MTLLAEKPAETTTDLTTADLMAARLTTVRVPADAPTPAPEFLRHPSMGRADEATIEPLGLNCYEISIDGAVQGYVRSTIGAGWERLGGCDFVSARSLGWSRSFAAAVRDLLAAAPAQHAAA